MCYETVQFRNSNGTQLTADTNDPASKARRGRPPLPEARTAILGATLALMSERGLDGTTMDAIAARAGVSKNTIYRRWSSKSELVADAFRQFTIGVELKEADDAYGLLRQYARDVADLFADPRSARLLPSLLTQLERDPQLATAWAEKVIKPRREAIAGRIREAARRGELRPGIDPHLVVDLLVAPRFYRMVLPVGLPDVPKRYADELFETVWRGIGPEKRT